MTNPGGHEGRGIWGDPEDHSDSLCASLWQVVFSLRSRFLDLLPFIHERRSSTTEDLLWLLPLSVNVAGLPWECNGRQGGFVSAVSWWAGSSPSTWLMVRDRYFNMWVFPVWIQRGESKAMLCVFRENLCDKLSRLRYPTHPLASSLSWLPYQFFELPFPVHSVKTVENTLGTVLGTMGQDARLITTPQWVWKFNLISSAVLVVPSSCCEWDAIWCSGMFSEMNFVPTEL